MADKSVFSDAGKRGAATRWGPPRIVRLDGLDADSRRLVLAFVASQRATETRKAVAVSDDASDGRAEVTHAGVDSAL